MSFVRLFPIFLLTVVCATARAAEAPEMTGAQLFQSFCAACHGTEARGNGPRADAMRRKPPDLTQIAMRNGGSFPTEQVRRTIDGRALRPAHFTDDMPVWGWEFYAYKGEDAERRKRANELVAKLIEYLRSIQQKHPR
jgi:mono/diheme cytochrome c family protein